MWTEVEREQVCAWLRQHDIDPAEVPTDSRFERDHVAGTWTIDIWVEPQTAVEAVRRSLTFAERTPWPLARPREAA